MTHKRVSFAIALVSLAVAALACNVPTPTVLPSPSPTVTPYIAATSPAETVPAGPTETQPPPATEPSPEATAMPSPTATETPRPPSPTPQPTSTKTPRPVNEGPLDFAPPTWVHSWEAQTDGSIKIVLKIMITGGAPPFTIRHEHNVVGQTWAREYYLTLFRTGCAGIAYNITVQSADGQTISKDYWIGVEQQPWCPH